MRNQAAIAGVGWTPYAKDSGVSTLTLALRAIVAALDDAGLSIADVDGLSTHRVGDSVQAAVVGQSLGIRDLRFLSDQFGGGSMSHATVAQASLAVATGVADVVVCWRAINARSEFRMGGTGRPPPDVVEFQYQVPYGYATPPQQFASVAQAYLHRFGLGREAYGQVAVRQRTYAATNERALMRTPITLDDHLNARWIVEPLGLLDCCLETDAAVAVVVTSAERARDLRHPPALVSGAVWGSGHTLFSNHRGDLTTSAAADACGRLWSMAGVGPSEVEAAFLYDAFTPLVLLQLEDYGFCGKGEGASFYAGTTLPINPHGGHLSEGYVHGLNHVAAAVEHVRNGASVALSTGQPGYVGGSMSALVLQGDE